MFLTGNHSCPSQTLLQRATLKDTPPPPSIFLGSYKWTTGCYLHVSPGGQGPAAEVLRRPPPVELHGAGGRWVRRRRWRVQRLRVVAPQLPLCCLAQLVLTVAPVHLARPQGHEEESKDEDLRRDRHTQWWRERRTTSVTSLSVSVCVSLTCNMSVLRVSALVDR